jgi:tetratricopeptide (TPR) repeat protein
LYFRWGDIVELKGYIEEVTNDERDLPIAPQLLIRQAILLSEQNRKDESLIILERLFHQKYNSFTDKENRRVQAVVNLTRGTVLLKFPGNSRDAIQYLETALQLYEEFDDEAKGVSRTAAMLGEAYLQLGEYREAERSFLKAFETTRNPLYQSLNLRLLGKVNLSNENWSLAFSYFNSGKNLYEHFSLKSKLDSSLDYARFRVDLVEAALLMSINDIYLLEDLIREIRLAINFVERNNYQDYLQKAKDFEQALIGISLGRESTD